MRVNTNSIGNYFMQQTRKIQSTNQTNSLQKSSRVKTSASAISAKEKEMFAKMYPQKRDEIMEYHYYQKNGKMSGVTVGSLFDRRG